MQERIQKILSARGICSRRKAEEYMEQGLVTVNGKIATIGQKADPDIDRIEVDGKVLEARKELLYYVMNKPVGVETTNRIRGSDSGAGNLNPIRTVRELLPPNLRGKIFPVGRLDKETSGLLLFTNDGPLAYRLTHPKFHHEKEYEVTVAYAITDGQLRKLATGMTISGEKTKPASVKRLNDKQFLFALTEGKNRQIRRMCQKVGCPVDALRRTRITTLRDDVLQQGKIRPLTESEKRSLLGSVGL